MVWVILFLIAIGLALAVGMLPMRITREPDREGFQDPEASRAYDRTSRWPVFWLERIIVTRSLARLKPRGVLVDLGCGPGHVTAAISRSYKELQVVGLDNNSEMVSIAGRRSQDHKPVHFILGDAEQLPFANNSVDCIVSSLSLHHWADAGAVFREIERVLKPGGQFLIFDVKRDSPRLVYLAFRVGQALIAPAAIKRTNGAVGSLWASYTVSELRVRISEVFDCSRVDSHFAWLMARGSKGRKQPGSS